MSTGQQTIQMGLFHLYKTFKGSSVTLVSNAGERGGWGTHTARAWWWIRIKSDKQPAAFGSLDLSHRIVSNIVSSHTKLNAILLQRPKEHYIIARLLQHYIQLPKCSTESFVGAGRIRRPCFALQRGPAAGSFSMQGMWL